MIFNLKTEDLFKFLVTNTVKYTRISKKDFIKLHL